jgi:hypothetical protein
LLVVLALAGCGDTTTSQDSADVAVVDGIVEPSPATATASEDEGFQWHVAFTVTLAESGGVGATINSVVATVTETADGIGIFTDEQVLYQLNVTPESNRIEPNGATRLALEIFYTLPGGGTEATVDLSISVIDDNGFEVGGSVQARVS